MAAEGAGLRIALVRGAYDPAGGAERFVQRIARALCERGAEVTLLTRQWSGDPELPQEVRVVELGQAAMGRRRRDASFARAVQQHLAGHRYDVVQSHERIPGLPLYRAGDGVHREWLAKRRRRDGAWRGWLDALSSSHRAILQAERELLSHPALRCIVCNSEMVRDEFQRHYGVDPARLAVIRNGVDLQRFRPSTAVERAQLRDALGWPKDRRIYLFVGSGFARKGVEPTLRAFAQAGLQEQGLLVLVGRDRQLGRYEALARSLRIAAATRFTGPRSDVLDCLRAADVFVLPTLYDPQSNAMLEAMACGLPVVTSTGCGAAELLGGDAGFAVDPFDVPALAAAFQSLLDPSRCAGMGAAARRAIEPYTLERMSAEYLDLYRRISASKP